MKQPDNDWKINSVAWHRLKQSPFEAGLQLIVCQSSSNLVVLLAKPRRKRREPIRFN